MKEAGYPPSKLWVEPKAHLVIHDSNLKTMARFAYSEMRHDHCVPYVPEELVRKARAEAFESVRDYYSDQIQMCCDTGQDPGGPTQIIGEINEIEAQEARKGGKE